MTPSEKAFSNSIFTPYKPTPYKPSSSNYQTSQPSSYYQASQPGRSPVRASQPASYYQASQLNPRDRGRDRERDKKKDYSEQPDRSPDRVIKDIYNTPFSYGIEYEPSSLQYYDHNTSVYHYDRNYKYR